MVAGSIEARGDGQDAMVARVKPNGKLDKKFGKKGITKFGVKDGTGLEAVALARRTERSSSPGDTSGIEIGDKSSQLFARLTEDGKLDKSFSGDGIFTRKVKGSSTRVEDVAIDKSGRILGAVGIFDSSSPDSTYGISAVKENGKKDKKFGKKGLALRDFGDDTSARDHRGPEGGRHRGRRRGESGDNDFLLARFTKKGKLDESFGFKGATMTDFGGERTT